MDNMKINRITFLIAGIIFIFFGFFMPVFLVVGGVLLFLSYKTNKKYKELLNESESKTKSVVDTEPVTVTDKTVKVTDIDGTVHNLKSYMKLDDPDKVLIAAGGKTYHTRVSCFKNWRPEMRDNFTGWTVMKKDDAINSGMRYCKFCEENDDITLDNILDQNDEEL